MVRKKRLINMGSYVIEANNTDPREALFNSIKGGKADDNNENYKLETVNSFVIDDKYIDNLHKEDKDMNSQLSFVNNRTNNTVTTQEETTMNTTTATKNTTTTTKKTAGRKASPAPAPVEANTSDNKTIDIPDGYEIATVNMSNVTKSAEQLAKMIDKHKAVFDNAVQRSDVWKVEQKSALITSMILGLPIPNMYANKTSDDVYDFLDGKQRSHAIAGYINNEYELTGVDPITLVDDDGKEFEVDINGFKFEELPETFKHAIQVYPLRIVAFDNIDSDLADDIFDRLNSGTALTAIEKSRVKAVSLSKIQEIAKHEIFSTLSDKAIRKYTDEDLVTKSLKICYDDNRSLDTKEVRPYMRDVIVTDDMAKSITKIYDLIYKVYNKLNEELSDESLYKKNKQIAKKIVARTHLVTLVGFCFTHKDCNFTKLLALCKSFYADGIANNNYKIACHTGSGHETAVNIRLQELDKAYKELNASKADDNEATDDDND